MIDPTISVPRNRCVSQLVNITIMISQYAGPAGPYPEEKVAWCLGSLTQTCPAVADPGQDIPPC